MRVLSLFGYAVIVVGIIGLWQVRALLATNPVLLAVQIAAAGLMIWARITFGARSFHPGADPTPGGLVTWGPYRFIRHPIYTSICLFALAGVVSHFTFYALLFGVVVFAGALIRIHCEEHLLRRKYPEYDTYSRRTKRMIPGLY
jgi:protein-S-isoprenylcysteine O-methyltransferase Ste14